MCLDILAFGSISAFWSSCYINSFTYETLKWNPNCRCVLSETTGNYQRQRRRFDLELNTSAFEIIILEVQLYKKEKWLICSCYKPPSIKDSVFERSFSELLNSLQIESPHILIIGDINFDMRKDNTLSNLCNTYDLQNLVCGPTCSKGAQPTSMLFCRRNPSVSNTL